MSPCGDVPLLRRNSDSRDEEVSESASNARPAVAFGGQTDVTTGGTIQEGQFFGPDRAPAGITGVAAFLPCEKRSPRRANAGRSGPGWALRSPPDSRRCR